MNSAALFGVYTAKFPFHDSNQNKIRPVIFLSKPQGQHNTIVVVVPVSSKDKRETADIALQGWRESGLIKPSVARVHRLTTILQSDLQSQLGVLGRADQDNLKNAIKDLLQLS